LFLWISSLGVVLTLIGCTGYGGLALHQEQLIRLLHARGVDPRSVVLPYGLTDEMRLWAHKAAPPSSLPERRLEQLRSRLLAGDQMSLEYEWGYTGTAIEVFEKRHANCLAFTNLFVGMAREVGLEVYFVAVQDAETYRKLGDLVVVSDHIAVGHGPPSNRQIYDFSNRDDLDYRHVRQVPDLTAIAMFHSNRGAEALQAGFLKDAVDWLQVAVAIDDELANAWVNLGVAYRRIGALDKAEMAYKKSLEADPRVYSAYQNLAALFRLQGREEEARGFETALDNSPNRNPYTYLNLGDISLRNGQLADAERFYRRAVNLGGDNPDCLAALGQAAVAIGDLKTARRMLKKAQKLDGSNARTQRLAQLVGEHG
jgi:tetratricopeptide (TPR) repeat protein